MDDYKKIIQELLFQDFSNKAGSGYVKTPLSTALVLLMFKGIIPSAPIDEHDIFSILEECTFEKELYTIYEEDENGNPTEKVKEYIYLWNLYKK